MFIYIIFYECIIGMRYLGKKAFRGNFMYTKQDGFLLKIAHTKIGIHFIIVICTVCVKEVNSYPISYTFSVDPLDQVDQQKSVFFITDQ